MGGGDEAVVSGAGGEGGGYGDEFGGEGDVVEEDPGVVVVLVEAVFDAADGFC